MGVHILICAVEGRPLSEDVDYSFDQTRIVIGRSASADIRIPHLTVSEKHATLEHQSAGYSIIDNHSTNGTRVNGVPLVPGRGRRLNDGDLIDAGVYQLSFHSGVALISQTTSERTAELARRLFRQSGNGVRVGGPRLVVLNGSDMGRSLDIPTPPARLVIGRADTCQLVLVDPKVSREHAELFRDLDGVMIRNLSAKNGLEINDQLVAQRRLRDGDELSVGGIRLLFEDPADEPLEALMAESDQRMTVPPPQSAAETRPRAASQPPPPVPAPEPPVSAPTVTAAAAVPAPPLKQRSTIRASDLVIYALAGLVIILSLAGLVALLQ